MADADRRGAANLRSSGRAPDGEVRLGRRQSPQAEDGARGGEGSFAEFDRDEDRSHRQRARLENDAGAEIERRGRTGNSPLRDRDAQAVTERVSGFFLGLRDLSGRGSERGSQDRLSQGVIRRADARRIFFSAEKFF